MIIIMSKKTRTKNSQPTSQRRFTISK